MGDSSLNGLVKAFQAGSREAFGELVGRYQNLATSIAFANSGDLQRSEDIAQQAFLVAWQKQSELADPDRFAGWIRGIVTNVARNERRIKENRVQKAAVELTDNHEPATNATPQNRASRKEQNELLWTSLNQIPLEYREPLVLFYREDLSVASVAEQLELSQDAVKQRLSRGRKMLKQEIETMVEDFLVDSKPAGNFTAGVIAALPAVSATAKAAAIKSTAAAVGKVGLGKAASTLSVGAFWGISGGTLGALGGLFGVWLGIRNGIQDATSEEEVSELKTLFRRQALLMLALALGVFAAVRLPAQWPTLGLVTALSVFDGIFIMLNLRFNRRQAELHQIHGAPDRKGNSTHQTPTPKQITGSRIWGVVGGVVGAFAWLFIVAFRVQAWPILGLSVFLCGLLIVRYSNFLSLRRTMPSSEAMELMRRLCRDLGVLQCLVIVLLWASGYLAMTQGMIEGYPVWTFLVFISALCTGLYFRFGYAAENLRRQEQGDA